MRVTTFYSYKGGVGRTLACANFGLYLAKTGQKVVLADMDFEAPGLDSKFPNVDAAQFSGGLLEQFSAFRSGGPIPDLKPTEIPLADDVVRSGGRLQLLPAGNYLDPGYYQMLSSIQWEDFTHEQAGLAFCLDLKRRIEETFAPDVLVIDSRTGLTEVGGLCTQVLPDTVLLFTCASPESLAGTKRIYERISQSPIVRARAGARTSVDLRVVISRMPRPEDLPALDQSMKKRLGIELDRLYYLFDERDLSVEEYLALDWFAEQHPAILGDYVDLFASLQSEAMDPHIDRRLEFFRSGLTRRSPQENERLIREFITLFPFPQVILEAARYYRIARGGDPAALANYIRYLDCRPDDTEALSEFAELCASMPEADLTPLDAVIRHLRRFGADQMDSNLTGRFFRKSSDKEDWRRIVAAIEQNERKRRNSRYRTTYLDALYSLGEWAKIAEAASDDDLKSNQICLHVAEAHLRLGKPEMAKKAISKYRIRTDDDWYSLLGLFFVYETTAEQTAEIVGRPISLRAITSLLKRSEDEGRRDPLSIEADPRFSQWIEAVGAAGAAEGAATEDDLPF